MLSPKLSKASGVILQNKLLSEFSANAVDREVVTGPVEATAAGNVLMQMVAAGDLDNLADGRALIARSFPTETYEPRDAEAWTNAYAGWGRMLGEQ